MASPPLWCVPLGSMANAEHDAPASNEPVQSGGRHVTFAEALAVGGRPMGWILGTLGVMIWVVWETPKGSHSPWLAVRWVVTAAIVAAWIVPTFLVPVPSAARAWRWAAALTAAAALLLGLR